MSRRVFPRIAMAALVFVACAAQARDAESFGEKLAREHPVDCMQRLAPVLAADVVQRDIVVWLEGIGEGRKLPPGWKRGESHFDAAFGLAYSRVLSEEAKHGPLATIDMQERFAHAFDLANAEERTQLASFLASPLGRSSWGYFIDDGFCQGLIGAMKERPKSSSHEKLVASLQQGIDARGVAQEKKSSALTPAERSEIDANTRLIVELFMKDDPAEKIPSNRLGIGRGVVFERLGPDVGGSTPKVLQQADAFAAATKP